ncbi:MAG TPA: ABC transporter permease, partial [Gemmataceae bacterium]|nr:ABC transporter permease [Gemmataceae bacterium]
GLLLHAAADRELQVRRTYMVLGFAALLVGAVVSLLPIRGPVGTWFLPQGFLCMTGALLFLLAFLRNETEEQIRQITLYTLGGAGAVLALVGLVGGHLDTWYNVAPKLLLPYFLLLSLLGLLYLWAFVAFQGVNTELGYWAGVGLGAVGLLCFVAAVVRGVFMPLMARWEWITPPPAYNMPYGLTLMGLGLLYVALCAGLCSDNQLIVLTRRELASLFFSPIAYVILLGLTLIAWFMFMQFIFSFLYSIQGTQQVVVLPVPEPMIIGYIVDWFPIICLIFMVPVLTMRLLSEERRTGTLEMLLTVPTNETMVVLSKFLAVFIFFMLAWLPWAMFPVALRVVGGNPFDYRPLIGFFLVLACIGSSFLSMGLFFSSLTQDQMAAAIVTFVGMVALTLIYFVRRLLGDTYPNAHAILGHVSYVNLLIEVLQGKLAPRDLLFWLSSTVFWLMLTVLRLNVRKWW